MTTIKLYSGAEIKTVIATIIITLLAAQFCNCQDLVLHDKLRPKSKATLDSLYPHATIGTIGYNKSDNTEKFDINCHCNETDGMIILVFDTNGSLSNKEAHHHNLRGLPDTIVNYIKKYTEPNRKFLNEYYVRTNNKGEVIYGIWMIEFATGYILWFKSSGKFIAREVDEGIGG